LGLIADSTAALMAPITDDPPDVSAINNAPAFDDAAVVAVFDDADVVAAFVDADVVAAAIMANLGLLHVPGVGSRCVEPFFGLVLVLVVVVVSDATVCFAGLLLFVLFFSDEGHFLLLVVFSLDDFGDAVLVVVFFFNDVTFGVFFWVVVAVVDCLALPVALPVLILSVLLLRRGAGTMVFADAFGP
jgi:hypothetical protein